MWTVDYQALLEYSVKYFTYVLLLLLIGDMVYKYFTPIKDEMPNRGKDYR